MLREWDAKTRIVAVDDEVAVRRAIVRYLQAESDLEIVGEGGTGLEAIELVARLDPDVLLLDLRMPVLPGVLVIEAIVRRFPRTRILIFSGEVDLVVIAKALRDGAAGFFDKCEDSMALHEAVRAVARGNLVLSSELTPECLASAYAELDARWPNYYLTFTKREREVLHLIGDVESSHEIAARLKIGHRTVDEHRSNLIAKLGLNGHQELQQYAVRRRRVLGSVSGA